MGCGNARRIDGGVVRAAVLTTVWATVRAVVRAVLLAAVLATGQGPGEPKRDSCHQGKRASSEPRTGRAEQRSDHVASKAIDGAPQPEARVARGSASCG